MAFTLAIIVRVHPSLHLAPELNGMPLVSTTAQPTAMVSMSPKNLLTELCGRERERERGREKQRGREEKEKEREG